MRSSQHGQIEEQHQGIRKGRSLGFKAAFLVGAGAAGVRVGQSRTGWPDSLLEVRQRPYQT